MILGFAFMDLTFKNLITANSLILKNRLLQIIREFAVKHFQAIKPIKRNFHSTIIYFKAFA